MGANDKPVYLQLRDRIADAILDGTYAAGDMLPSVRAFAQDQGANPLTVAKAYQLFQEEELIEVRRGVGMFVASGAAERLRQSERARFLTDEWPAVRSKIERLGIDFQELLETEQA